MAHNPPRDIQGAGYRNNSSAHTQEKTSTWDSVFSHEQAGEADKEGSKTCHDAPSRG